MVSIQALGPICPHSINALIECNLLNFRDHVLILFAFLTNEIGIQHIVHTVTKVVFLNANLVVALLDVKAYGGPTPFSVPMYSLPTLQLTQ